MKQFHERSFDQRFLVMGDEAETIYENKKPLGNTVRFGWRKPKGINFKRLPATLRFMPDYYAQSGYLVEVVGLGRDGILKGLKVDKYDALKQWKKIGKYIDAQVCLFVWNSHTKQYVVIMWDEIVKLVAKSKRTHGVQEFDDGNKYYPIDWQWLEEEASWVAEVDES